MLGGTSTGTSDNKATTTTKARPPLKKFHSKPVLATKVDLEDAASTTSTPDLANGHDAPKTTTAPKEKKKDVTQQTMIFPKDGSGVGYVWDTSTTDFVMPPPKEWKGSNAEYQELRAKDKNNQFLRLNLGWKFINVTNPDFVHWSQVVSDLFTQSFLEYLLLHLFWDQLLPLRLKQVLAGIFWTYFFFPLHSFFLGRSTAAHKDASLEYHALTTLMWGARLLPLPIPRMRFALEQIPGAHPPDGPPVLQPRPATTTPPEWQLASDSNVQYPGMQSTITRVSYDMTHCATRWWDSASVLPDKNAACNRTPSNEVTGYYIQHHPNYASKKVILFYYGGAFLGGSAKACLQFAEKLGQYSGFLDVFLPNHRLVPEYWVQDALDDSIQALEYLITVKGFVPKDIVLFGLSSGGGIVLRVCQAIAEYQDKDDYLKTSSSVEKAKKLSTAEVRAKMPKAGVLMSPFVNFGEPMGSIVEYCAHDLIVTQRVVGNVLSHCDKFGSDLSARDAMSPMNRPFAGLPPLLVVTSEHEAVYDENLVMMNRARAAGVRVDVAVWRYMCHVFPMMAGFIPEGRQGFYCMADWIQQEAKA